MYYGVCLIDRGVSIGVSGDLKSDVQGVYYKKRDLHWEVVVPSDMNNGKNHLGTFTYQHEAEEARLIWDRQNNYLPLKVKDEGNVCPSLLFKVSGGVVVNKVNRPGRREGAEVGGLDTSTGYRKIRYLGKSKPEHSLIWFLHYGHWPVYQIDHKNGVRDDNSIENLRDVPQSENGKNRKRNNNNTSGCTGVYWCNTNQAWLAQITIQDKRKHLGYFDDINDAIAARKSGEVKYGFHKNHDRVT